MSKPRLTYTQANLRFISPLETAKGKFVERQVVLLALRNRDGSIAVAEAAPWPVFGTETLNELLHILPDVAERLARTELPTAVEDIGTWLAELNLSPQLNPSLCFALECVGLALIAQSRGIALHQLLNTKSAECVNVNGFVADYAVDREVERAQAYYSNGYHTIKLKVGTGEVRSDIERVCAVRDALPTAALRVDANGAWTFDEANAFLSGTSATRLQYVEDPLRHAHQLSLKVLHDRYGVHFALDHSERDDVWREARLLSSAYQVVVVKPQVFGLTTRLKQICQTAAEKSVPVVVTSCMESSIGLTYVAHAAAAFGSSAFAHGLSTASLFHEDSLMEPLCAILGKMIPPNCAQIVESLQPKLRRVLDIA